MTQHPDKKLSVDDIPSAAPNALSFGVIKCATGGYHVFVSEDGGKKVLEHKGSEQAAIREAIRLQKRENGRAPL